MRKNRCNSFYNIWWFLPDSISGRINDCKSDYVITADEGLRGGKTIHLKSIVDEALVECPNVKKCIIIKELETELIGMKVEMFGITT